MRRMKKIFSLLLTMIMIMGLVQVPLVVRGEEPFSTDMKVVAGRMHTLVLRGDGTVWACGRNSSGQLGDGTTTDRNKLVQVSGLEGINIKEIAAGYAHSLALDTDGNVWAWGSSKYRSLIDTNDNVTTPTKIESLSGIIAIAAGTNFSLALDSAGNVYSWGANYHGNLGNGDIPESGSGTGTFPKKITSLSGITAIAARGNHGLALDSSGNVWSWGENNYGQLANGNTEDSGTPAKIIGLSDITAIAAGYYFNLALSSAGEVYGWGDNSYGELGNGEATTNDLGDNVKTEPVKASISENIKEIAAGGYASLALDAGGNVLYAWGNNNYRQLGVDEALKRNIPEKVSSLTVKITAITGYNQNMAIDENGKLWAWGSDQYGQLGIGSNETRNPTPTLLQTATASVSNNQPTAGEDNTITFTVKDAFGDTDISFSGDKVIIISGLQEAPDGTYGKINVGTTDATAEELEGTTKTMTVNFTEGQSQAKLQLNKAAKQTINFSVEGVSIPQTNSLTITPTPASPQMVLTQDITAPESNGGEFSTQPIVTLKDTFGNVCVNDSATKITVSKKDEGNWILTPTETTTVTAVEGIVTFTGLGATNDKEVTGAKLSFTAADIEDVVSGEVTLPEPTPAYTAEAESSIEQPIAGEDNTITFTVKDALENVDTSFNGEKNITISGVQKAPNDTYGSFNGTALDESSTGDGQTISVTFTEGQAQVALQLNKSQEQILNFSIDGVATPQTNSLTITSTAASADRMEVTTDIGAPTSNGGKFNTQPIVTLKDTFGNVCVNDSATEVTVSKKDEGNWVLTITETTTTTVTADKGIVTFTGLGAENAKEITGAQLSFTAIDMEEVVSRTVDLLSPEPAWTAESAASSNQQTAGEDNTITFTVKDALENVDTSFNGEKNITISGVQKAPNDTYGSFNGTALDESSTGDGQTISVTFTEGQAEVKLQLNKAAEQTINFSIEGVSTPQTNSLTITPTAALADRMEVTTDIGAPTSNGGKFSTQPIVTLKDTFGNVCVNDSATEITVSTNDTGDWNLTGTTKVKAINGVVTFKDLGAENDEKVDDAQLLFKAKDIGEIVSKKLTLMPPNPPNAPSIQSIVPRDRHIVITWNMLPDVSRYNLYQSTVPNSYKAPIANINTTVTDAVYSYDVKGLENGRQYYFTVTAVNGGGESGYAKEVSATPQVLAPGTPVLYEVIGKDERVDIAWKEVEGSTGYKVYTSTESGSYTTPIDTVAGSVYNCSVDGLTNGTTYYFVVKALNLGGESDYSNELSGIPVSVPDTPTNITAEGGNKQAVVNFDSPEDNGGSSVTGYIVTSNPEGITAEGSKSPITITGLTNGTSYTFTVKAKNSVGESKVSEESSTVIPKEQSSGSDDTSDSNISKPSGGASNQNTDVKVNANGEEQNVGKENVTEKDGVKIVEVITDSKAIDHIISQVIKENKTNESEKIIEIPISSIDADVAKGILTGNTINNMQNNNFTLNINTEDVDYIIPAKEIGIDKVASLLDVDENSLEKIEVGVEIKKVDENKKKEITKQAQSQDYDIVFPPIEFKITAKTTSTTGEEKEIEISKFMNYVPRVIELPKGINLSQVRTAVVYSSDGTFSHVPTVVFEKDGRGYVRISSLTNSYYTVISHNITVSSVENHWSKTSVTDMANRLIIKNPNSFKPNGKITRGEFAEYITKAMGVYRSGAVKEKQFSDVDIADELADAITIAADYGIIKGYEDGTFRPDGKITREEAMTMYQRAMDILGLEVENNNKIEAYQDKNKISPWAYEAVKATIGAGVFNGRSENTIAPKGTFTYAEGATAVRNLLIKAGLINEKFLGSKTKTNFPIEK